MATISMIKGNGGVPQPVYLSDAAVTAAYERVMGGLRARAAATQGLIESATNMGNALGRLMTRHGEKVMQNEDEVASATYRSDFSKFLFDMKEETLSGKDKEGKPVALDSEGALKKWCENARTRFEKWHEETMKKDAISPAGNRLGTKLKSAASEDMERFVFSTFSEHFRQNRVREKNTALSELEIPENYSSPESFAAAKRRAASLGATSEEVSAAAIKGRSMKIKSDIESLHQQWREKSAEEFLLGRTEALEEALKLIQTDFDGDWRVSADETAAADRLKATTERMFTLTKEGKAEAAERAVAAKMQSMRKSLEYAFIRRDADLLKKTKEYAEEMIRSVGTDSNRKWVEAYFDGDLVAAKNALTAFWEEAQKSVSKAYEIDYQKEQKARNEMIRVGTTEALDALLSGDPSRLDFLKSAGFENPTITVIDDARGVLPGAPVDAEGKTHRFTGTELLQVVEACRKAYSDNNPEELVFAANRLFSGKFALSASDLKLIRDVLQGAKEASPEQRAYADELFRELRNENIPSYSGKMTKARQDAEENARKAYFSALQKFYSACRKERMGLESKGGTVRKEIEPLVEELKSQIREGKTWDERVATMKRLMEVLGR